jgi:hypothetical protein
LNKLGKKPRGLLTLKLGFDEQTSYEREREREGGRRRLKFFEGEGGVPIYGGEDLSSCGK